MKRKFVIEYAETRDPQAPPQRRHASRKGLWIALIGLAAAIIGFVTALIKTGILHLP